MDYKKYTKSLLSVVVVAVFVLFFYREFRVNWESLRTFHLKLNWEYLVLGILMMIANYVCVTWSWHIGINYFDNQKKLKFTQSIALVNISQLGKYIPGKLWSYVAQIYWLASKGVSKTTALYLNIMTTILPIIISLLTGSILLMMLSEWHYLRNELLIFICFLLIINLIILNRKLLNYFLEIFSRIRGRRIIFQQFSSSRIIYMELLYILGAFFWALAGCSIAMGIGLNLDGMKAIFVSSAMLLGDVIGFLILVAPGGLGVREGAMYFILKSSGVIQLALIFPIVVRLFSIITDLIMGVLSVMIIGKSKYCIENGKK